MQEETALDIARLRIRQLVSVKGRRGCLIRAALCLVRVLLSVVGAHDGEIRVETWTNQQPESGSHSLSQDIVSIECTHILPVCQSWTILRLNP